MNNSDREALNNALSDWRTIEQLSSSGEAVKMKMDGKGGK